MQNSQLLPGTLVLSETAYGSHHGNHPVPPDIHRYRVHVVFNTNKVHKILVVSVRCYPDLQEEFWTTLRLGLK